MHWSKSIAVLAYALFAMTTATLFLRPAELFIGLAGWPIYETLILSTLLLTLSVDAGALQLVLYLAAAARFSCVRHRGVSCAMTVSHSAAHLSQWSDSTATHCFSRRLRSITAC